MQEELVHGAEFPTQLDFPVVGIGASAGGLEAVTSMFQNIEGGTGMAFVLVTHLHPDHESMMTELLSNKTRINVRKIYDDAPLEPDCLHVIPPGSSLRLKDGKFKLDKFAEPRGLRRPIDSFFTSLAQAQGERAACVVLSGTGGDGTAGLRIVKEFGGLSVAQSPEESRYDGMPSSAIGTKLVDFTLPAMEIVSRIKSFFEGADASFIAGNNRAAQRALQDVITQLKLNLGIDYSGYKKSTLLRRLNRRLQLSDSADFDAYISDFVHDEEEQAALARDFLINVTSFFRDRDNFQHLRERVLIPLIENTNADDEVRIWVPGCSTGQEPYSLAMMIDQICLELGHRPRVQIFATDIDEPVIKLARQGVYSVTMLSEIPRGYREAYTIGSDACFEITPRIREMVRFSVHNLLKDPPFAKVDLISCRNMLIYLGDELQAGVLPLFHFALRPGGHLFLGTSETVSKRSDMYVDVDQRARIFRRNDTAKRVPLSLPIAANRQGPNQPRSASQLPQAAGHSSPHLYTGSRASVYESYAPPFLRVTKDDTIVDSSGDLSLFLKSDPVSDRTVRALAREGVYDVAAPLIEEAFKTGRRYAVKDIEIASPFGTQTTAIIAHPMDDETVAVVFVVKDRLKPVVDQFAIQPITRDRQISTLQRDLSDARLQLKFKIEEAETANEELKSSNEEMMSINEELQSANEELTTANEELKNKIDELTLANADLDNFLQSSDLAIVVLDRNLKIRHVTDAARRQIPLLRSDEGRDFAEFNIAFDGLDLIKKVHEVIEKATPFATTTAPTREGRSYFLRVTPYFFSDGSVEGASITLTDISQEVELRRDLLIQSEKMHLAMEAAQMGSWDSDIESGEMELDALAAEIAGLDGPGLYPREAFFKDMNSEDVAQFVELRDTAIQAGEGYVYTARLAKVDEPSRWVRLHGKPYTDHEGRERVSGLGLDVTDLMTLQQQVEIESTRRELAMRVGRIGIAEIDIESGQVTVDDVTSDHLGLPGSGSVPLDELTQSFVEEDKPLFENHLSNAIERGEEYEFDFRVEAKGHDLRWMRTRGVPYTALDGRRKIVGPTIDISAHKQQGILLDEMSHRIKNLFAVISGLVQAAPKKGVEARQMSEELVERIVSLSNVYDLARKEIGASGLDLQELLGSVIAPHRTSQSLTLEGPPVLIDAELLNTFTLVIHELTTNAAKYGALSDPAGSLSVVWEYDGDGRVAVTWREAIPGFEGVDDGSGFGSFLIKSGIRQLHGNFDRTFCDEGTHIQFSVKLNDKESC